MKCAQFPSTSSLTVNDMFLSSVDGREHAAPEKDVGEENVAEERDDDDDGELCDDVVDERHGDVRADGKRYTTKIDA